MIYFLILSDYKFHTLAATYNDYQNVYRKSDNKCGKIEILGIFGFV